MLMVLLTFSCKPEKKENKISDSISGNWIIIYPEHQLKNEKQKKLYASIQDSIISLYGLKLISFKNNGHFRQMDSLTNNGKWEIENTSVIIVANGGRGFDKFKTTFTAFNKGVLQLTEYVNWKNEKLRLLWQLVKVEDQFSDNLFSDAANVWRHKPGKSERPAEIKNRLAAMLNYYSVYFKLVAKESDYFIGTRVILPFEYYQHSIGLNDFDSTSHYASCFYNIQEAEKSYEYLQDLISILKSEFPKKDNYVEEYSAHMAAMAKKMMDLP
jgi:uncharacterized protein YfkK (UPF0435 family)